ncbi:sulfatase-like hydrolase/transferase [Halorussus salinus]|uniref:sulfatase-like hydrolase/transferase n=1 Tax=Halorussus salinus TaxID=1364935 RepID=UPI0010926F0A|nr:sulfatase-like hydrolase/transferase [Halorussus salinus]
MQRPNILLIVMDTARADFVEDSRVMPYLNEFAKECTWFSNTFANAPWTLPSHSSIFTGKYPSEHGTGGNKKYFDSERNIVSELNKAGYQTASFSNNPWISPDFGFDDFDTFTPCWQLFRRGADLAAISQEEGIRRQLKMLVSKLAKIDAPFTLANALYMKFIEGKYDSGAALTNFRLRRWLLDQGEEKPFFAFVNYMEPHLEYNPPHEHREKFLDEDDLDRWNKVNQDPWAYLTDSVEMDETDFQILKQLYRGELHYLDSRLEQVFTTLKNTGLMDSTAVFVTADHGENLGEHGLMDHQYSLNEALLRVPLLVHYPDEFEDGGIDDRMVELRDLYPTILSLAGIETSFESTEYPPQDLTNNDWGREAVIAEYLSPQPSVSTLSKRYDVRNSKMAEYDRALRSIRTADQKLVEGSDGTQQLYRVGEDEMDQDQTHVEGKKGLAEQLQKVVGDFDSGLAQSGGRKLPESNRERLEDLGYL